jgi:hypothetical protein
MNGLDRVLRPVTDCSSGGKKWGDNRPRYVIRKPRVLEYSPGKGFLDVSQFLRGLSEGGERQFWVVHRLHYLKKLSKQQKVVLIQRLFCYM